MADDAEMEIVEETTDPSLDSSRVGTEENEEVVYKLHEEIDNLNLVLDHLERKNGDIYTRIEQLLATFQQNKSEEDDDEDK
ncbi:uncharacterized protein LOC112679559 isoform X2 [Sipha flava]|uniref:Uncharacterized protein LOC112679559 isoform X2 n=1 Tax=Sipha flava TaxID=143950 RepID=A0A8B8F4G6_9HEMI|nr:uncharacterized protein LOC112679559 isoform X2 [Sipha flava]